MKRIALAIVFILVINLCFADYIKLENGDILYGEIKSQTASETVIETSIGEFVVKTKDIQDMEDEPPTYDAKKSSDESSSSTAENSSATNETTNTNDTEDTKTDNSAQVKVFAIEKDKNVLVKLKSGSTIEGKIIEVQPNFIILKNNLGQEVQISVNDIKEIINASENENTNKNNEKESQSKDSNDILGLSTESLLKISEFKSKSIVVEPITKKSKDKWQIRTGYIIISDEDFLRRVGEIEMADDISQKRVYRSLLNVGGIVIGGASLGLGIYGLAKSPTDVWLTAGGATGFTLGTIITIFSLPKDHYLTYSEASSLAEEYNNKLMKELGLESYRALLSVDNSNYNYSKFNSEETKKYKNITNEVQFSLLEIEVPF